MTGGLIELTVDKVVAGGRALGRHDGRVVLVWGAIPGERVRARVERVAKGVVYGETVEVVQASPDRRRPEGDWRCGGHVFAHVATERHVELKADIVVDAFARLARYTLPERPVVCPSPLEGYRLRARLHVQDGVVGFLREGTHEVCPAGPTRQLLPATVDWLGRLQTALTANPALAVTSIELAENLDATERVCHIELAAGTDARAALVFTDPALSGLCAQSADRRRPVTLAGRPSVTDYVSAGAQAPVVQLRRDVRAFFQGNRFLLRPFVESICAAVETPSAVDLYAGVGLFGLALAARGTHVTLVEGDPTSAADLDVNAAALGGDVRTVHDSVERYLSTATWPDPVTVVADPPRTGLSAEARSLLLDRRPRRVVYVSCDPATLARDARHLFDAGYRLVTVRGFDLFPMTAHIESVVVFDRG